MFSAFSHRRISFKPFAAHCCHMVSAIKHPVPPDRVKQSFVIFGIRALWRLILSVRVPGVKNYKRRLNQVWHRMFYICTHMATVGIKGFNKNRRKITFEKRTLSMTTTSSDLWFVHRIESEYCRHCLTLLCSEKNTHSHFLSYFHVWCVDLNKNCSKVYRRNGRFWQCKN